MEYESGPGHHSLWLSKAAYPMSTIKPLILILILALSACSGGEENRTSANSETGEQSKNDHPWKSQTGAINKAREVEGMLKDSAVQQREAIDAAENE